MQAKTNIASEHLKCPGTHREEVFVACVHGLQPAAGVRVRVYLHEYTSNAWYPARVFTAVALPQRAQS